MSTTDSDDESMKDHIYIHSRLLLTVGLVNMQVKNFIHYGNGVKLLQTYKLLTVWCKALGFHNYANGLLELQYQIRALHPSIRHDIIWNRSINLQGKKDSNIPIDLAVEHENRRVKEQLSAYRGDYTDRHLARISKASTVKTSIEECFYKQLNMKRRSGRNKQTSTADSISILVQAINPIKPFTIQLGRQYNVANVSQTVLAVNYDELNLWAREKLDIYFTKPFYKG